MWFSSVKAYHFNSIKVRLERKANGVATLDGKFQFHKGAIRTFHINVLNRVAPISIP